MPDGTTDTPSGGGPSPKATATHFSPARIGCQPGCCVSTPIKCVGHKCRANSRAPPHGMPTTGFAVSTSPYRPRASQRGMLACAWPPLWQTTNRDPVGVPRFRRPNWILAPPGYPTPVTEPLGKTWYVPDVRRWDPPRCLAGQTLRPLPLGAASLPREQRSLRVIVGPDRSRSRSVTFRRRAAGKVINSPTQSLRRPRPGEGYRNPTNVSGERIPRSSEARSRRELRCTVCARRLYGA